MNSEDNVPTTTPRIIANEKLRIESPPTSQAGRYLRLPGNREDDEVLRSEGCRTQTSEKAQDRGLRTQRSYRSREEGG